METFWSYFAFIVIVLVLLAGWFLLNRLDKRTKNGYKKAAYRLLDTPNATRQEIIKTIKMLRLYGGRFRKDKEFMQLTDRLIDKLQKNEPSKS
jgi:hypothetical protein